MQWDDPQLLPSSDPFVFTSGVDAFKELAESYTRHSKGLYILAPPGTGKTYYINQQSNDDWIDGDILWYATNAQPYGKWWEQSVEEINRVESRCDVVTMEAKHFGFWIMGASNFWLKPDAIVIPDLETHKKYIEHREKNNYDGGLTSKDLDQLILLRDIQSRWKEQGVPCFESIEEAVKELTKTQ